MGEQSEVIGEIKVVQLSPEGTLDAVSLSICRLPHHPVDSEEEQERRQKASLTNAGPYIETTRQLSCVYAIASYDSLIILVSFAGIP